MDVFSLIIMVLVGIALLIVGANIFVDGASGLAKKLKIPDIIIGMTIVAFGTSAPELAVSISSAISGTGDVLLGNVVGSNIFNILLILGITALICKVPVQKKLLIIELPFLLIISILFVVFSQLGDNELTQVEGVILFSLFVVYIIYMVFTMISERKREATQLDGQALEQKQEQDEPQKKGIFGLYQRACKNSIWLIVFVLIGLAGVVFGADFVVTNITTLSEKIDNPDAQKILAVLVVALGTSLPELVTSVTAACKGKTDIAMGNIIGSNIFNILLITGLPVMIFGITFTADYLFDLVFAACAVVLLGICLLINRGKGLNKLSGVLLLTALAGYLVYLII